MRILIDADSCKKINLIEKIAKNNNIDVIIFCDTSRIMNSSYSEVRYVSTARDAVDFAIFNECRRGDIVITHDGGLASLILSKKAYALNSSGFYYSGNNIDAILNERHLRKVYEKQGIYIGRNPYLKQPHPDLNTSLSSAIRLSRQYSCA